MLPFLGSEALAAGALNRYQLATQYDAVFRNVYVPKGQALSAIDKAVAAWLWSGRRAVAAGLSAAALHGSGWIDADLPAELNQMHRHKTAGILLHSDALTDAEVSVVKGVPVTTPARTAYDLGRRRGLVTAVIRVDALIHATGLKPADIQLIADQHRGARGIEQLRQVVSLCEVGSESPQETRTRLVLTNAGLRPTRTQIDVFNRYHRHVGRIDMGWDEWLVGVEYDGIQHWADPKIRARDIDKQVEFQDLGWRIIRVGSDMIKYRPHVIVQRVRAALQAAGAPV